MTSFVTSTSYRRAADRTLSGMTLTAAFVSAAIVFLVIGFLIVEAWPALQRIGIVRFFTDKSWHPLSGRFSLVPMIVATLLTSVSAMLIATPLGVCSAVFSRYYAPRLIGPWYRRFVELLAGIPSVVYGFWGLTVLVPLLSRLGGTGQSFLAATLVLSLMILPTVAITSDTALAVVPASQLRGAAALGLGRWSIIRRVALVAARPGILSGLVLALARAIGETMAVLMVSGNVVRIPESLTTPVRTLTANVALEMGYATADHRSTLFVSGLMLMAAVGVWVVLAEILRGARHGE